MTRFVFSRKALRIFCVFTVVNVLIAIFLVRHDSNAVTTLSGPSIDEINRVVGPFVRANEFPSTVNFRGPAQVTYTLNEEFQKRTEKVFQQHKPDYGAAVVLDAATGEILTMVSFGKNAKENLVIKAGFPAASVFKIVTAAAALDQKKLESTTMIGYGGGNHTLYKKNLGATSGRWMRYISVREAFARSINTVFAKVGVFFVGPKRLEEYAERFFFNRSIASDVPIETGSAHIPTDDEWGVAEAASGYTRKNTMSPLQGALMAAAIANDGRIPEPYIVKSLRSSDGRFLYQASPKLSEPVIDAESVEQMKRLMTATITSGTSRKSFRELARIPGLELGGKTGSLTGTDPVGKYDWFVGYGEFEGRRLAISVLTINEKIWKIRSSQVAADYLKNYFNIVGQNKRYAGYKNRHVRKL